jgi:hypothetical protein
MSDNMHNTANDEGDRHNRMFPPCTSRLVELPQESSVDLQQLQVARNVQDDIDDDTIQLIPGTSRKRPARPAEVDPNPLYLPIEMWQLVFFNLEFFDRNCIPILVTYSKCSASATGRSSASSDWKERPIEYALEYPNVHLLTRFSIIRCRLVCKEWLHYVSGAPELRDLLFTNREEDLQVPAGEVVEDEDEDEDDDDDDDDDSDGLFNKYSNFMSSEHWLNHRKGKSQIDDDSDNEDEYEQAEGEDEESEIPQIHINLKAVLQLVSEKNVEPKLCFGLEVDFDFHQENYSCNKDPVLNFKEGSASIPCWRTSRSSCTS